MKNLFRQSAFQRKGLCLTLALLMTLSTPAISGAQDVLPDKKPWTTVASAGTVNEADVDKVVMFGPLAYLSSQALATTEGVGASPHATSGLSAAPGMTVAVIRYNVVAVDGLFAAGEGVRMEVRFHDNGGGARVIVSLKELNLETGITTTRLTFNSNIHAPSPLFQTHGISDCSPAWGFDFSKNAYFIDAQLIRIAPSGDPGLAGIRLGTTIC